MHEHAIKPLKNVFPAAWYSTTQAGLSVSAFIWATGKILMFAGPREDGQQEKKLSPALQVALWEHFPAEEPRTVGRNNYPGPDRQWWPKVQESFYST